MSKQKNKGRSKVGHASFWKGAQPKPFRTKSDHMSELMRNRIADRIAQRKGWSRQWILRTFNTDDKLRALAEKHL